MAPVYIFGPILNQISKIMRGLWLMAGGNNPCVEGLIKKAAHNGCVIIWVKLVGIQEILDFDSLDVHDIFVAFANRIFDKAIDKMSVHYNEEACRVYDLFVQMMEQERDVSFDVLQVRVPPPKQDHYTPALPLDMTGHPPCFVVRNLAVIQIEEIEKL